MHNYFNQYYNDHTYYILYMKEMAQLLLLLNECVSRNISVYYAHIIYIQ